MNKFTTNSQISYGINKNIIKEIIKENNNQEKDIFKNEKNTNKYKINYKNLNLKNKFKTIKTNFTKFKKNYSNDISKAKLIPKIFEKNNFKLNLLNYNSSPEKKFEKEIKRINLSNNFFNQIKLENKIIDYTRNYLPNNIMDSKIKLSCNTFSNISNFNLDFNSPTNESKRRISSTENKLLKKNSEIELDNVMSYTSRDDIKSFNIPFEIDNYKKIIKNSYETFEVDKFENKNKISEKTKSYSDNKGTNNFIKKKILTQNENQKKIFLTRDILTKTTKDDSLISLKILSQESKINRYTEINCPEELHYFYVSQFHENKVFAIKFN